MVLGKRDRKGGWPIVLCIHSEMAPGAREWEWGWLHTELGSGLIEQNRANMTHAGGGLKQSCGSMKSCHTHFNGLVAYKGVASERA